MSDKELKKLMELLADAVHRTLSESPLMAEVLSEVKQAGYAVSLSIDATFSEPSDGSPEDDHGLSSQNVPEPEDKPQLSPTGASLGKIELTVGDESFLRAVRIATDQREVGTPEQKESPEQKTIRRLDETPTNLKVKTMELINGSKDMQSAGISFKSGLSLNKEGEWKKELERIFDEAKKGNVHDKLLGLFRKK